MTDNKTEPKSPIFSFNIQTKSSEYDKKPSKPQNDSLINIMSKIQEKQNELNNTAESMRDKVEYLSSKQVIGFSFMIGMCASLAASLIFYIFAH